MNKIRDFTGKRYFYIYPRQSKTMAGKKVLVTGGMGFIGSHTVVDLVQAGYEPVIVDNLSNSRLSVLDGLQAIIGRKPLFYQMDCTDENAFRKVFEAHPDLHGAIHFAAFKAVGDSVKRPLEYYRNNITSTVNLLRLMGEFGVRHLVFSGSCTVYGQPECLPVTEESPLLPANSPYGYTKQVCERIITDFQAANIDFKAVLLRYFNPIGAHPSGHIGELPLGIPENLVPYITQTAIGKRVQLQVFGSDYDTPDGTCIRDYIHVCDLAAAHVSALTWMAKNPVKTEVFNLGSGTGNTVMEMILAFEKVSQQSLNYVLTDRRPGDVEKIYASCTKAEAVLNWKCRFSHKDALRDAWEWEKKLSRQTN